jgi:hypothetical protein
MKYSDGNECQVGDIVQATHDYKTGTRGRVISISSLPYIEFVDGYKALYHPTKLTLLYRQDMIPRPPPRRRHRFEGLL